MCEELKRHFQRKHPNGPQVHEKVVSIPSHQGNVNQNHNKISPHTSQNGHYQTVYK